MNAALPFNRTLLALLAMASAAFAQSNVMRDVVTHDQLVQAMKQSAQNDPMKKLPTSTAPDASVNLPRDLVSQSDFLCFNGVATLVPKRAILKVPSTYSERVKFLPGSSIQSWVQFQTANRNWISTVEVTPEQAAGTAPLSDDLRLFIEKSTNIVVAVYKIGPISVLPPKDPAVLPTATATIKP